MGRDSVCREPARITACWPKTAATGSAGVILPGRRQKAVLARPWGRRARILPASAFRRLDCGDVDPLQRLVVQWLPWLPQRGLPTATGLLCSIVPARSPRGWPFVLSSILSRQVSKSMDRIAAVSVVLGSAAVAAACFFILWLRRRRARSLIRGLFQDYFAESFAAEELGRRVRASVGRRFTGGSEFFAEAVAAFQHAVNARLPATHTAQDEAKLLGQFAALKTEFGLTDRYRIEGWRAGQE
jgi:hypothetical protein